MNEIIGSFFFRLEEGNLVGQYTNTSMNRSLTERAIRVIDVDNDIENFNEFLGSFNSTWEEISNSRETAVLSIGELPGAENKFILIWHVNGRIIFRGEGFFVKPNLMVGHYTN